MKKLFSIIVAIIFISLTIYCCGFYPGNTYIYILFSIVSYMMVTAGFRKNALFIDTFIALFFIFGFWLKFTIRLSFFDGQFHEEIGSFNGSRDAYDNALLISICGFSALIFASYFREYFLFKVLPQVSYGFSLEKLYQKYRNLILIVFVFLFLMVGTINMFFGIYQKGEITQTFLPFGLNGIFKWLLLFGFCSFSTVIIKIEMKQVQSKILLVSLVSIFEVFISSVSMLSRGMILNVSSVFFGIIKESNLILYKIKFKLIIILFSFFSSLFIFSIYTVNSLREYRVNLYEFYSTNLVSKDVNLNRAKPLIIDRWVGIEGVMAVSSYPNLGWELMNNALVEKYNENVIGFYDSKLISSPYLNTDFSRHHHISLPGIVAFLFYPGSFYFLFTSLFLIILIASYIEYLTFILSDNNLILCSLIGQVIAYRFANFGYVPLQSYLLFGSIILNILIIYSLYRISSRFYK